MALLSARLVLASGLAYVVSLVTEIVRNPQITHVHLWLMISVIRLIIMKRVSKSEMYLFLAKGCTNPRHWFAVAIQFFFT
jgi:hypothetical protein